MEQTRIQVMELAALEAVVNLEAVDQAGTEMGHLEAKDKGLVKGAEKPQEQDLAAGEER
ncbi:hypothetical protein D3C73_1585130 [compost metagenome]